MPVSAARIALIGHGALGLGLLQGLLESAACEVVGVFRWSRRPASRDMVDAADLAFGQLIASRGLREILGEGVNSYAFSQFLAQQKPDYLLIGSWGEILKPHLLHRPDFKVINCHPSLLPSHRGPNPYVSTIRAGEAQSGVTFHLVDEGVDTGPILLQYPVPIAAYDTGGDLRDRCAREARARVGDLLALLDDARDHPDRPLGTPQSKFDNGVTPSHYGLSSVEDAQIRWERPPSDLINQVRAFQPWLDSYGYLPSRFSRRLMIRFSRLTAFPAESGASSSLLAPGSLRAVLSNAFIVTSSDPQIDFRLEGVSVYGLGCFWSAWPTLALLRWLLPAGARFETL
ncbi:MAG: hypothetical protein IPK79_07455 [Vampirovibrionales bacterium]|nr:hypothetical protein [Vampirovibrionales bacterium]